MGTGSSEEENRTTSSLGLGCSVQLGSIASGDSKRFIVRAMIYDSLLPSQKLVQWVLSYHLLAFDVLIIMSDEIATLERVKGFQPIPSKCLPPSRFQIFGLSTLKHISTSLDNHPGS